MVRAATTAKFPGTLLTVADIGLFTNDEAAAIVLDATAIVTTIDVDDASEYAQYMWLAARGANGLEVVQVTDVNLPLNRITVTRAKDGTVAVPHLAGESTEATLPAIALNQMRDELIAHAVFLGVDGECVHWDRGLELEPSSDSCAILTLNLKSTRTNKKFIQFSVDDVETGAMLYDAANDAVEFQNIRVDIGTGSDILLEDNRTLRIGTSSNGRLLYDSADGRVEYRSDVALRFEALTGSTEILTLDTSVITANKNIVPRTDIAFDVGTAALRWRALYAGTSGYHVLAAASDANDVATLSSNGLLLGAGGGTAVDVRIFRDLADRLALASGDSLNIVLGNIQMAGVTLFESDRDLAVDLIPNAANTLNVGSLARVFAAAFTRAITSDSSLVLTPASGSNLNLAIAAAGLVQVGGVSVFESDADLAISLLPNANATLNLGSGARNFLTVNTRGVTSDTNLALTPAAGSNVNIAVSGAGGFQVAGTTVLESDRDLAIDLVPNADNTLSLGSAARRFNDLYLGPSSLHILNAASDANDIASLGSNGLEFGAGGATALDVRIFRGAPDRLDLATGDSFNIVSGNLTIGSNFTYSNATGQLALATSGSSAGLLLGGDALLYRGGADILATPDRLLSLRASSTDSCYTTQATGDATGRFDIRADGQLAWGDGTAARDTVLARGAPDRLDLATGDNLRLVLGNLHVGQATVGTSGTNVLALHNGGTEPTTSPADTVQLYSVDNNGAGTATFGWRTEQAVAAQVAASTHTLRVKINGTVYGVLLTNVPT